MSHAELIEVEELNWKNLIYQHGLAVPVETVEETLAQHGQLALWLRCQRCVSARLGLPIEPEDHAEFLRQQCRLFIAVESGVLSLEPIEAVLFT